MLCSNMKGLVEYEPSCMFENQVKFMSNEKLAKKRSDNFVNQRPVPQYNIWRKKPPDFSVRLYTSLNLPRTSEDSSAKEIRSTIQHPKKRYELGAIQDSPRPKQRMSKDPNAFLTRFKPIGSLETSILYVKNGTYPKEKYSNPRPHDFRQYETGIPDFTASYTRDPFNLKLKTLNLSSLSEHAPLEENQRRREIKRFIVHKPAEPMWDSKLILPKIPWPPKSASYTRHRRRRGVYSAFMDRVEEKFIASNQKGQNLKGLTLPVIGRLSCYCK